MCGIFGFIARGNGRPNLLQLKRMATITQRRGHHAFGLAWLEADGTIHTSKRPGPATANLGDLNTCCDARILVGHCRWATHGNPQDNRNNHPHPAGRGWIVHNGIVANYQDLIARFRLKQRTECDSEVLGLLIAKQRGRLAERAAATAEQADGNLAMLGIWAKPNRLLVVRNGNPLFYAISEAGFYFASQAEALPSRPAPVTDAYAGVIERVDDRLLHTAYRLT